MSEAYQSQRYALRIMTTYTHTLWVVRRSRTLSYVAWPRKHHTLCWRYTCKFYAGEWEWLGLALELTVSSIMSC